MELKETQAATPWHPPTKPTSCFLPAFCPASFAVVLRVFIVKDGSVSLQHEQLLAFNKQRFRRLAALTPEFQVVKDLEQRRQQQQRQQQQQGQSEQSPAAAAADCSDVESDEGEGWGGR